MNNDKALEISNLSYTYRSDVLQRRITALKGLSLDVYCGEAFGFLGPNGAGKTTTIKSILGLIRPKSGSVKIFGRDSRDPEARAALGYLPEQPYFYDHLKVREILSFYANLLSMAGETISNRVDEVLEKVKLTHKASSPMRSLSKGLTQRVALAQAILANPKLLILDEPFSGLDPLGRKEFKDILMEQKAAGTTIFMSSHILSDVEFLCDRVSILVAGNLKGIFSVKDSPELARGHFEIELSDYTNVGTEIKELADSMIGGSNAIKLGFNKEEDAKKALMIAVKGNASVKSYQFIHSSLEDLFVELVKKS